MNMQMFAHPTSPSSEDLPGTHSILLQLARALHHYGTPAHRLEEAIGNVAKGLGLMVHVFSMPTGLLVSFQEGEHQTTHLLRVANGAVDLEKQCDIDELADKLIAGQIDLTQAIQEIHALQKRPDRYPKWLIVLAFGLCAISVARILNAGWFELLVSCLGGLLVGGVVHLSGKYPNLARLAPGTSSFLAALFVTAMAAWWGHIAQSACHMAAIIVLVPGLSLTVAMTELSTQHLVSGTARLAGAIETLLQLGFGLALGTLLSQRLFAVVPDQTSGALPGWTFWLALLLAGPAFLVLFRARPKDLIWMILAGVIAMLGTQWGIKIMGPRLGPFFGALLVGLSSNLFARIYKRPASIILLPGIILLVPGSIGLKSISSMIQQHTLVGLETAFTMVIVTVSLVFGILIAALILPPRRSL